MKIALIAISLFINQFLNSEEGQKMRYQFYREHKYVSAALNDVERLIAKTDFRQNEEVEAVLTAFIDLKSLLEGHAHYENERLHKLLAQRNSLLYEHAEADHADQEQRIHELETRFTHVLQANEECDRIRMGYQIYLDYRKFVSDNLAHLHEEETVLLPELQRLYSDEELQQVEGSSYRDMTPDEIVEMVSILFPHMNPVDRRAILDDIKALAPEKYQTISLKLNNL